MMEPYVPAFVRAYQEKAFRDPANPLSWYMRASESRARGDLDEWERSIEAGLALPHNAPQQRWFRAAAQLTRGDWSGWADYEVRAFHADERSSCTTVEGWVRWTHPAWVGSDLADKTILVLFEQGAGSNIQMLRFIPVLIERAKHVVVMTYPRVVPLVQCNFGEQVTVVIEGVDKPFSFDCYANTMSLPHLIGRLPPFVPLRCPRRRPRLPDSSLPIRAGICWAGNPAHGNDAQRSMPAAHLAPLLARTDIEWHSLQVGECASDADRFPSLTRPWPRLVNFGDTADLISDLDIVVAVDTAVGHLAGCLGVPTYLLLPFVSEWRWGLGDRTPWYPSMKIIRQPEVGDWANAVSRVQHMLDRFLQSRHETIATIGC
jgi:hypothetical protein